MTIHILEQTFRLVVGLNKEVANSNFLDRGNFILVMNIQFDLEFIAEDGELKIVVMVWLDPS